MYAKNARYLMRAAGALRRATFTTLSSSSSSALRAPAARRQASSLFQTALRSTAAATAFPEASSDEPAMFCFQCEQTADAKGCSTVGVCGKSPEVAGLQDQLVYVLQGIGQYGHRILSNGGDIPHAINRFVSDSMFATLTNVNFDAARFHEMLNEAVAVRAQLKATYEALCADKGINVETLEGAATYTPDLSPDAGIQDFNVLFKSAAAHPDILSLTQILEFGLKGTLAYMAHAENLGKTDPEVYTFVHKALDALASQPTDPEALGPLLEMALECGKVNFSVMGLLNDAHKEKLGVPEPTKVRTTPIKGKALLVSGHDLVDLEAILKATEGTGVNVYTHGEMLPGHAYPELKKYPHLAGNYGGAWQMQKLEFSMFPGPVIVTTNCIVEPRPAYSGRIYTTNAVGYEGIPHITEEGGYEAVVQQALDMPGFLKDDPEKITMTGFGHDAVLGVADQVVGAVKNGDIKQFVLIGGCDGAEGERSYYAKLANALPKEAAILTLACGKYRFNKSFEQFGNIGDSAIPRMLDIGQCNDSYSAVQIALALQGAFNAPSVNDLPLSIVLSWFEQKAVAVLLTLLHLDVQGIRIGPKLPAFVTPNVWGVLQDKYGIKAIGEVEQDVKDIMNKGN